MGLQCDKCGEYVPRYRIKRLLCVWLCNECEDDRTMEKKVIAEHLTDDELEELENGGWSAYVLARKLAKERLEKGDDKD